MSGRVLLRPMTLAIAVAGSLALVVSATGAGRRTEARVAIVVAQVPAQDLAGQALAGGTLRAPLGEGGRLVLVSPAGKARVLTSGFASAADPEVSFDGQSILFAAQKQKGDPWCIWEMKADGSGARKITCGAAGARQPVYQSIVYTITPTSVDPWSQIAFVGVDPGQRDEADVALNTSLWSCKLDGSALRRLTYNLSNDMDPVILPDGRMIYAGWLRSSASHGSQGRVELLGVNEDGLDYQIYAGDEGLRVKQMPTPTPDGRVVFVESDAVAGDGAGRLASVSQRRPLHTHRSLTQEGDGLFRAPAALPDGQLLVAWRSAAPSGRGQAVFGIYRLDLATGVRKKLLADPSWQSLAAKPIAPRAVPDARSSVVKDADPEGKLYTLDVNINDLGTQLPPGTARRLRIVEGVPGPAGPPERRLLGEIPLAEDGSYQVQVPANTPFELQLLDGDGLAIRSSAWVWVRNHGAQGCVGCHENPERTPPNRFVKALQSPAPVLTLPREKRRFVRFQSDIEPIVAAKCLSCHGRGSAAAGSASLAGAPRLEPSARGLLPYITPGAARRSRLVWHLLGRNTARPWDAEAGAAAVPPIPPDTVTADEVRAFVEWIDLGGQP